MQTTAEKIVSVAATLFATRGFRGTTTLAIAKKAAVNEGTIFRIFRSKRRLYRATLQWKLRELAERSLPPHPVKPHEVIKQVIEARGQDPQLMRLILFGALEAFPEFKTVLHTWRRDYYARLNAIIERQKQQGSIAESVPTTLAAVALTGLGIYHYLFFEIFKIGDDLPVSRDELTEFYCQLWSNGLAAAPRMPGLQSTAGEDTTSTGDCRAGPIPI
jgi:AcrR family transcriptional regulator